MPISAVSAFQHHQVTREDGVGVLPKFMVPVAALEAGYCLAPPTIDEAMDSALYPGQMTIEEFSEFCDKNKGSFMSAEYMAKCVVLVAPSGVITRASLEAIMDKFSSKEGALADEEVEALFTTLDVNNKGAITTQRFMRALYGDEGVYCLAERRRLDHAELLRLREAAEAEKLRMEEEKKNRSAPVEEESPSPVNREEKKKKASACC
ncbi:hypothetical protein LSCM1_02985 [Leishmania martiniquensis]|uniref:EF-hand domain-containing protein n=1 Tax=Leishmania martiniquensis TaxID=1580590 RepID=A0A836HCY2_9TRYP|nr:hypothetical protein LSCM1_02985 [Leishmania martiniquensis]